MPKIDRTRRATIKSLAKEIRHNGQIAGWGTSRIAAEILSEIAEVRPLEAWRLARGWSRQEVIDRIAGLYQQAELHAPPVNSSMLCRWEHGQSAPSAEYADALCRLYQVAPEQLGLSAPVLARCAGLATGRESRLLAGQRTAEQSSAAVAVRESVQLAMAAEGPGGGPMTVEQLHQAVRYYDLNYAAFPPGLLAGEVRGCRSAITGMLGHSQPAPVRRTMLHLGGWFSALLGNLAFHAADFTGAEIHLRAAAGLAAASDSQRLLSWVLGAQSMLAGEQGRPRHALDLAVQAVQAADTPLRRAQALSWAQLPALVRLGRADEALAAMAAARREMDASPVQGKAGRFGFDRAEFELHLAEAAWGLCDLDAVSEHAAESLRHTTAGRPGWAAATLILARASAADGCPDRGAELALQVLDTIPAAMLRSTAWGRLAALDKQLTTGQYHGPLAAELHDRLSASGTASSPRQASTTHPPVPAQRRKPSPMRVG
jgi:transcriptional regulator with XRE-family HTH domain